MNTIASNNAKINSALVNPSEKPTASAKAVTKAACELGIPPVAYNKFQLNP